MTKHKMLSKSYLIFYTDQLRFIILFMSLPFLLNACSHQVLRSIPPDDISSDTCYSTPMVYYLPKGKVRVQYKAVANQAEKIFLLKLCMSQMQTRVIF